MHRPIRYTLTFLLLLNFGIASSGFSASPKGTAASCIEGQIEAALLTPENLKALRAAFQNASPETKALRRKLQKQGFQEAALNEEIVKNHTTKYTKVIPDVGIWDQQRTGDCWDFAGCRALTDELYQKGIVSKRFQVSKTFIYFHSMLEKSDKWLADSISVLQQAGLKEQDLDQILNVSQAVNDGGYYEYFNFLMSKYGIVPENAMKSTASFRDSTAMNQEITFKLASIAQTMKDKYESFKFVNGQSTLAAEQISELLKIRAKGMEDVYHILASHLGVPPESFKFKFKDGTEKIFTPESFAKEVVKYVPKKRVVISSDPTLPYGRTYDVPGSQLGVERAKDPESADHFLNVKNDRLLALVKKAIDAGQAVWFGADASQAMIPLDHVNPKAAGIMHPDILNGDKIYGFVPPETFPKVTDPKAQRMLGTSAMDHAMVIVGYELDASGNVVKLKVANSWGKKAGTHGYFHMYREWFEQFVTQIGIDEKLLSAQERKALKRPRISLEGN